MEGTILSAVGKARAKEEETSMRRPLCRFPLIGHPSSRVAILLLLCWAFLVSSLVPFNTRSVRAGTHPGNNARTKPASAVVQSPRRDGAGALSRRYP